MGVDDIKEGAKLLARLIPPIDGDPIKRFRYDASMSFTVVAGGGLVLFHILWICGVLAMVGLEPPFAKAEDVRLARERQDMQQMILLSIETGQINDKIMDAKTKVCLAIRANDQSALDAWARELETQKQRYRDAVHQEPNVRGCDELLVGGNKP